MERVEMCGETPILPYIIEQKHNMRIFKVLVNKVDVTSETW